MTPSLAINNAGAPILEAANSHVALDTRKTTTAMIVDLKSIVRSSMRDFTRWRTYACDDLVRATKKPEFCYENALASVQNRPKKVPATTSSRQSSRWRLSKVVGRPIHRAI